MAAVIVKYRDSKTEAAGAIGRLVAIKLARNQAFDKILGAV